MDINERLDYIEEMLFKIQLKLAKNQDETNSLWEDRRHELDRRHEEEMGEDL